jgi:hypothetical protein
MVGIRIGITSFPFYAVVSMKAVTGTNMQVPKAAQMSRTLDSLNSRYRLADCHDAKICQGPNVGRSIVETANNWINCAVAPLETLDQLSESWKRTRKGFTAGANSKQSIHKVIQDYQVDGPRRLSPPTTYRSIEPSIRFIDIEDLFSQKLRGQIRSPSLLSKLRNTRGLR